MTSGSGQFDWKKGLLGCAIGCATIAGLVVAAMIALGYWAYMPGSQVATAQILDEDSVAVFRLENLGADPGVSRLIETAIRETRKATMESGRRELPFFARWMMAYQMANVERDARRTQTMLPRELTATLQAIPGEDAPQLIVAVNLSRFPRLIRFMVWMARGSSQVRVDGGRDAPDLNVGFAENTMVVARTDVLEKTLARMQGLVPMAEAESELIQAYTASSPRWDFHGVVLNRDNLVGRFIEGLEPESEPKPEAEPINYREVRKVSFGFDVVSDDEIEGEVEVDCADPEKCRKILDEMAKEFSRAVQQAGARPEAAVETRKGQLILNMRADNLRQALVESLKNLDSIRIE